VVLTIEQLEQGLADLSEIVVLAVEEQDEALLAEANSDLPDYLSKLDTLEFQRMFAGPVDINSAYVEVQAGIGRYRGPGLGRYVTADVSSMGREQRL
jgi:peptide chain release factor 2